MSEENYSDDGGEEAIEEVEEGAEEGAEAGAIVAAETAEEFQEEVQEALENGATESEVKQMIEEFQLKVNGKTVTKKLDLMDKDAVKREMQMAAAGRQSMQELAELRKQYETDLARLKNDPWSVLQELELDPDDLAEKRLQERVNELKKSPEQIEREKLSRELNEARKREADAKKRLDELEMSRLEEQANAEIQEEIEEALSAYSKLPNVPRVRQKIADAMLWSMDNGFGNVRVEDVLPSVEEELRGEFNNLFDQLPEETMEHWIGKKNAERLRQKRVAAAKKSNSNAVKVKPTTASQKQQEEDRKEKQRISSKDFFKSL